MVLCGHIGKYIYFYILLRNIFEIRKISIGKKWTENSFEVGIEKAVTILLGIIPKAKNCSLYRSRVGPGTPGSSGDTLANLKSLPTFFLHYLECFLSYKIRIESVKSIGCRGIVLNVCSSLGGNKLTTWGALDPLSSVRCFYRTQHDRRDPYELDCRSRDSALKV